MATVRYPTVKVALSAARVVDIEDGHDQIWEVHSCRD
jgi:hypothetical protein